MIHKTWIPKKANVTMLINLDEKFFFFNAALTFTGTKFCKFDTK